MKMLFLVSHLKSGGSERTVAYLSSYMAQHGFDVTILSLSDDIFYDINSNVKLITLGIESAANTTINKYVNAVKRKLKTKAYIKKSHPDVVFCMLPETAKYILNLHKKGDFSLITSERNNPAIIKDPKLIALKNKIFEQSDGIVFQTERAKEYYPQSIQSKSIVIPNAVGNNLIYSVPRIEKREKKISAIGRLDAQKDYSTLLHAFADVLKVHPDFRLEIFGEGPDAQKIAGLTKELDIEKSVCFKGVQKDAIVQAANSACFVLSSAFEGMPNALMEAMAVGLPCVSTDCPNGPSELIVDGKNGILVPVGDSDSLSAAILRMIEDTAFAESCGQVAKDILNTHSVLMIANQYAKYIKQKCKGRRK